MKTISFDFDETIWDTDFEIVIQSTLNLMNIYLSQGDRVIITPGHPHDISYFKTIDKSDVLIREQVSIHFDDMKGDVVFNRALQAGIEIRFPPHIEQFTNRE
jgi:uncharacterized glyoxalase superfamily protein PhnB